MAIPVPSEFQTAAPRPLPAGSEALLRLLDDAHTDWEGAAELALSDLSLALPLLLACPLQAGEAGEPADALKRRLQSAGIDLLRAWLLAATATPPPHSPVSRQPSAETIDSARLRGECARHIAIENRYPRPQEACLAAMLSALAAPDEAARLGRACGLAPPAVDALQMAGALDEHIRAAHPLARILWSALRLAGPPTREPAPQLVEMSGLSAESLASLRADVGFLSGELAARPPTPPAGTGSLPPAVQAAALGALYGAAFADLDAQAGAQRLMLGCRLIHGLDAPLMLCADAAGQLTALFPRPDACAEWLDELALQADDDASAIALALRSHSATSQQFGTTFSGRSAADWQIARWLGGSGIACLPLHLPEGDVVAVFPLAPDQAHPGSLGASLSALLGKAASQLLRTRQLATAQAERADQVRERCTRHIRTVVHEARNPLTVIRSYVGLLQQRKVADPALHEGLGTIGDELGRMTGLLERLLAPPSADAEDAGCAVGELLDELQALCAAPLFERHGIRFEVRKPAHLARVSMSASDLRQVLLNLLRNASEALSPGCRCVLAVPGRVAVDGHPCLEIRLVDNGPGLPTERIADLFAATPSAKGGEHQGIGLSIVRDILARWRATLVCRSQPGTGTSFQLFIPLEDRA